MIYDRNCIFYVFTDIIADENDDSKIKCHSSHEFTSYSASDYCIEFGANYYSCNKKKMQGTVNVWFIFNNYRVFVAHQYSTIK